MKETSRINIYMPTKLVEQLDEYSDSMNISRSGAICFLVSTYFKAQENMKTAEELLQAYKAELAKQESEVKG